MQTVSRSADEAARLRLKKQDAFIQCRLVYFEITQSAAAALMLARMRFLSDNLAPDADGHRWIERTHSDWQNEIFLGKWEQQTATQTLEELEFIHPKEVGKGVLRPYRVDNERVEAAIDAYVKRGIVPEIPKVHRRPTRLKSADPTRLKSADHSTEISRPPG